MKHKLLTIVRILLGWTFLWAFLDKTLGLGFATITERAWINGGSPTYGFLTYSAKGPFMDFYKSIAGNPIFDWLFMLGLLLIGLSFIFNRYVKYSGWFGALLMILMYTAGFILPENNPLIDEHIIYAILFLYYAKADKDKLRNNG